MSTRLGFVANRRALIAACCIAALAAFLIAIDNTGQARAAGAVGPDVTVFAFTDVHSYGSSGGFVGYALGTRSCNRGSSPLNWCSETSSPCAPAPVWRNIR